LSLGNRSFSERFVDQDLVIADPGHPLRSRQMASVSAFGAFGLSICNIERDTSRHGTPSASASSNRI
jgi:hypothetical protein